MADQTSHDVVPRLVAAASTAARAAAQVLTGAGEVQRKSGHNDVVTEHDAAAEQVVLDVLTSLTPQARVLGEEGTARHGGGPVTWHVDPIDGTSNYASGAPLYCISIGATVDGRPVAGVVLDPVREELFATGPGGVSVNERLVSGPEVTDPRDAVLLTNAPYEGAWFAPAELAAYGAVLRSFRGVRRIGSSALALAWVAAGRASVACELRTNVWDHAAGAALVLSGGGRFIAWAAGPRTSTRSLRTSRPQRGSPPRSPSSPHLSLLPGPAPCRTRTWLRTKAQHDCNRITPVGPGALGHRRHPARARGRGQC